MKTQDPQFQVVSVTLNAAIDRTVTISNFTTGAVNRVGTEQPWSIGRFYGSAYFVNPRGKIIAKASEDKDELLVADMDWDMVREVRNLWQFYRDRRPETYASLAQI